MKVVVILLVYNISGGQTLAIDFPNAELCQQAANRINAQRVSIRSLCIANEESRP